MTHFNSDGVPLDSADDLSASEVWAAQELKDDAAAAEAAAESLTAPVTDTQISLGVPSAPEPAEALDAAEPAEPVAAVPSWMQHTVERAAATEVQATAAAPAEPTAVLEAPMEATVERPAGPGPPAGVAAAPAAVPAGSTSEYAPQQAYVRQQQAAAAAAAKAQPASYAAPVPAGFSTPAAEKKSSGGGKSFLLGLLGGLLGAAALVLGLRAAGVIGTGAASALLPASTSAQTVEITPAAEDITVAQAVAAKSLPSVVSIYCTYPDGSGMGSGVILDETGNIITNNHVVENAESISVTIEGRSYDAVIVGTDASSDLAVVRAELDGATVTPIETGDSSQLKVGDWVMTVGSPFGLDQSVSAGIVSSLYRNELMTTKTGNTLYANLIQVDAAINPGNSGGALVDSQGRLVGISTLFSSDTESFAGIGFAIPGNYALDIAGKMIRGEAVTHAYIGLSMQTVNAQNAQANHLSVNQGAYVAEVMENSPAAAAGIQEGDIIVAMAGEQIASADGMILAVRSHSIGETVQVTVVRGDEELTIDVTLGSDEELQERQRKELEEYQQQLQQQNNVDDYRIFGDPQSESDGSGGMSEEEWQLIQEWYNMLFQQENQQQNPFGRP